MRSFLKLQALESRDVASVTFTGGQINIVSTGTQLHGVTLTTDGTTLFANEEIGSVNVQLREPLTDVTSIAVQASQDSRITFRNETNVPATVTGGPLADVFENLGTGLLTVTPGLGNDVIVSPHGAVVTDVRGNGNDVVVTGDVTGTSVLADKADIVTHAPTHAGLNYDRLTRVLVISAEDAGSVTMLGRDMYGRLTAKYVGFNGTEQSGAFGSTRFVVFLGGAGNDTYVNPTCVADVAFGGAGDDQLLGGHGKVSVLNGDAGDDFIRASSGWNVVAGGAGADQVTLYGSLPSAGVDMVRMDAFDHTTGLKSNDLVILIWW